MRFDASDKNRRRYFLLRCRRMGPHGSKNPNRLLLKIEPRGSVNSDDIRHRLMERDRQIALDTRTEAERWLGDPPPGRQRSQNEHAPLAREYFYAPLMSALPSKSGHVRCNEGCPHWANSGHPARSLDHFVSACE
jgi:hypothetical protein